MTGTITPDVVELVTVPGVELIDLGTWEASTGTFDATLERMQAAIAAQGDPGYCTPIVKLGHVDLRGVEWPAVARLENLRMNDEMTVLIGDYIGMPKWLAESLPTMFPRRSIEGAFDLVTATRTKHAFALTAVALLGETEPAIATLADVKALVTGDGIEGVLTPSTKAASARVTLTRDATGGRPAVTTPAVVRAAVAIDDIYAAFSDAKPEGSWAWIRQVYAGNDAFIVVDNDDGDLFRIPWSEDGDGKVTFGAAEKVAIDYVPVPADGGSLVLMSRGPVRAAREEAHMPLTEEQLAEVGLAADATPEQVIEAAAWLGAVSASERDAALEAATAPSGGTPSAPELPEGVVAIDQSTLDELRVAASNGNQAHETLRRQARDALLIGAVKAGKFAESRRTHFEALYDADEKGTTDLIAKLAANTIPVVELGHGGEGEVTSDDALFASLYPDLATAGK